MFNPAWFSRYQSRDIPRFDQIVQCWDTANKPSDHADYSACVTIGVLGNGRDRCFYLLDVYRRRLDFPGLVRAVKSQAEHHGAHIVLVEDKASGTQLVQTLKDEGMLAIKAIEARGDKEMRASEQTLTVERGRVHLPMAAS